MEAGPELLQLLVLALLELDAVLELLQPVLQLLHLLLRGENRCISRGRISSAASLCSGISLGMLLVGTSTAMLPLFKNLCKKSLVLI